jgi:hypothetical protein
LRISSHIKWTAWLGFIAIAVQLNAVPLSVLLFRLNQQEIARTQCEHKMPNCNGHCYLMKQLAKTNGNESDKQTECIGIQLDQIFLLSSQNNLTLSPRTDKVSSLLLNDGSVHPGWPSMLLQPPRSC